MASVGLIAKAVENLRSLQLQETLNPDHEVKKKEKIANCLALTNGISLATVKTAPQALNLAIETLLCLCDDPDSDVRTMADESLNKIIRAVADGFILKVQFELYREIKRNGAARCLRAALWRFGLLSHMIRPVKAKVFASQLTPCIVEISKRKEDIVIEVLSQSLPLILKTLGHYLHHKDIKILLRAFFLNVTSNEAVLRRASANMIATVCLNCRKSQYFFNHVIEQLIDMLFQSTEGFMKEPERKEERIHTVLGAFGCLRLILQHIDSSFVQDSNEDQILDQYVSIYELSLHYAKFYSNHNVINAALETLSQLLQNPLKNVIAVLLSKDGISQRMSKLKERGKQWSSKASLATTSFMSEDNLESSLLESDFMDSMSEIAPKVEKWMTEMPDVPVKAQARQVEQASGDSSQIIDTKDMGDYSSLVIGSVDEDTEVESNASSDLGKFEIKPADVSLLLPKEPENDDYNDELDDTAMSVVSQHDSVSMEQFLQQRGDLNIGSLFDVDSLNYCCRFLASSFLLAGTPGQLMPDKLFRVSVKSLALTCLGNVLRLRPELLLESLTKVQDCEQQMISDVLLLIDHTDPQIRGNVTLLVGSFLQGVFTRDRTCQLDKDPASFENLVGLILKGLEDESATTCRQTLQALGSFLPSLLESDEAEHAIVILKALPKLVKNPYFLVKIKLTEIVCELPYTTIKRTNGDLKFQESMINALLRLLSDPDQRVRKAAGNAIVKIIPHLYYESPHEDAVTRKASRYTERYLSQAISSELLNSSAGNQIEYKLLIDSLTPPYDAMFRRSREPREHRRLLDEALSRILGLLADRFFVYESRYLAFGCCETLSLLSETYQTSVHSRAWDCPTTTTISRQMVGKKPTKKNSRTEADHFGGGARGFSSEALSPLSSSFFSQTIILLSSSPLSYDLSVHRYLLLLAGNLASGIACSSCKSKDQQQQQQSSIDSSWEIINDFRYWTFFKDKQSSKNVEQLLLHVMRVLNIFQHVVEDLPSPIPSVSKTSLSLTSAQSLSPKRKLLSSDQSSKSKSSPSDKSSSEHNRLSFRFGKEQLGSLTGQAHYLRLYELLRAAHSNYRVTLEQEASELYLGLLNATLQVLSQILEVASVNETSRIAEEILHYLQSTVLLSPTMTVQCVRQLLKSLFGTNLIARWSDVYEAHCKKDKRDAQTQDGQTEEDAAVGFYEQCFQKPAKLIAEMIKNIGDSCRSCNEPESAASGSSHRLVPLLQRKEERKMSSFMKILSRNSEQNSVLSSIRLFEPLVIKSLIQYSTTNLIDLQCQVLMLLSQLIHLHINYCLMDSDKVFIGFVMKQFEFIEEGHVQQTEKLLPKMFDFLVRLSYEKYHSKIIIGVPKIIQLCDGLMASGQPPLTHCIPALVPVVEELFLARIPPASVSEEKELETTREVLVSMMLRLIEYPQVVELLAKCLLESRTSSDGNGEEKWRRWSRQTIDTILPMLSSRKLRLETRKAFFAVVKLFSAVSPTVFRPVDPLLKALLSMPPYIGNNFLSNSEQDTPTVRVNVSEFKRWIGMVNVIVLSLVSYSKEEAMLARLSDLCATIPDLPEIISMPMSSRRMSGDPLNVSGVLEPFSMLPEKILSRFIFRAIGAMSSAVIEIVQSANLKVLKDSNGCDSNEENEDEDDESYVIHQFALLLQLCIHMFETGSHCKVANASVQLIQGQNMPKDERLSLNELNDAMTRIGADCPIIACQWTYLLTLLGYNEMSFWSRLITTTTNNNNNNNKRNVSSINNEIIQRASTILFCDYLCENVTSESDRLSWLLNHHIETTIALADEVPVRELVAVAVHRDPKISGLFLRCVGERDCRVDGRPAFAKRLLLCLEGAHQSQSGQLLLVLVSKLLRSRYLVLSRMAAKIASRRVEVLLMLGRDEAIAQLSRENFKKMMSVLNKDGLAKKHEALVGLLNKLATTHYDLEPLTLDNSKPFDPAEIKSIKLDRAWYLSQVKSRCSQPCVSYGCFESAWLLSHLNLDECLNILSSKDFDVKLLHECVIVGTRLTHQTLQQLELDGTTKPRSDIESILYTATKRCLIQRVRSILKELPEDKHRVYIPNEQDSTTPSTYSSNLTELLRTTTYRESLFSVLPAVVSYLNSLGSLSRCMNHEHESDFARLAVLCLETSHFLVTQNTSDKIAPRELELALKCARAILRDQSVARTLSAPERYGLVCSATAALMEVASFVIKGCEDIDDVPALMEDCSGLKEAMDDEGTREYAFACLRMAALVGWLERKRRRRWNRSDVGNVPRFFEEPLESLIVSVARQPLVNSFVLTPPLLWKHGCDVTGTGATKCQFALFSSDPNYIPELDVLEEFMFRISLLGWNSRQQFEEIWMVLLGVLNVSQMQSSDAEGDAASSLNHTAALAVQAIANLLAQTLILPCLGDPNDGSVIRHPRDPQLSLQKKSTQRLFHVQDLLLWKYEYSDLAKDTNVPKLEHLYNRGNLEPSSSSLQHQTSHTYGQLSVSYLWSQCALHEDKLSSSTLALKARRDEALAAASLDVNSCLRFLLELYGCWINPGARPIPLRLLHEVVKSLLVLSELFVERSQFQWMLEACLDLWKVHSAEDEMIRRHLVIAVCKASAVLTPLDAETLDKVRKLVEVNFKYGSLTMRLATLHGILYLLQSAVLADCEETMNAVHPLAVEYIQRYLDVSDAHRVSSQSEEHQCTLWALVFFLLEHAESAPLDTEAPAVLELVMNLVTSPNISTSLHRMLLQGLERLVATRSAIGKVLDQIVKLSIERLRQPNPALSLPALQLFLTCMYTDTAERFNNPSTSTIVEPNSEEPISPTGIEPEIERSIERSSAFFDKIKKGYPAEVRILCAVLAEVVVDFFPPLEILTKVIGEFLSPHQPHPRLMSAVVFKVCERACNSTQLDLLQTWVVFSIQNFIQSLPLIMSTWCLSCFFISTSMNPWLRALFPHVQSRIGKYEYEDKKILCLAAADFYSALTNDSQKKTFVKTFEDAAKNIGSPFGDILASF